MKNIIVFLTLINLFIFSQDNENIFQILLFNIEDWQEKILKPGIRFYTKQNKPIKNQADLNRIGYPAYIKYKWGEYKGRAKVIENNYGYYRFILYLPNIPDTKLPKNDVFNINSSKLIFEQNLRTHQFFLRNTTTDTVPYAKLNYSFATIQDGKYKKMTPVAENIHRFEFYSYVFKYVNVPLVGGDFGIGPAASGSILTGTSKEQVNNFLSYAKNSIEIGISFYWEQKKINTISSGEIKMGRQEEKYKIYVDRNLIAYKQTARTTIFGEVKLEHIINYPDNILKLNSIYFLNRLEVKFSFVQGGNYKYNYKNLFDKPFSIDNWLFANRLNLIHYDLMLNNNNSIPLSLFTVLGYGESDTPKDISIDKKMKKLYLVLE